MQYHPTYYNSDRMWEKSVRRKGKDASSCYFIIQYSLRHFLNPLHMTCDLATNDPTYALLAIRLDRQCRRSNQRFCCLTTFEQGDYWSDLILQAARQIQLLCSHKGPCSIEMRVLDCPIYSDSILSCSEVRYCTTAKSKFSTKVRHQKYSNKIINYARLLGW